MNARQAVLTALAIVAVTSTSGFASFAAALPSGASWVTNSYDCTKVVYTLNYELYMANIDGSNSIKITSQGSPVLAAFPRLSPDNTKIAYVDMNDHHFYVIKIDGTGLTPLAPDFFSGGTHPTWSPDNKKVAFEFNLQVYTVNADGTGLTNITPNLASRPVDGDGDVDWSPDGSKLVFDRVVFTGVTPNNEAIAVHDLAIVNSDSTGMTQLIDHGAFPRWAHDGTKIFFESGSAIKSVKPDGTGETSKFFID